MARCRVRVGGYGVRAAVGCRWRGRLNEVPVRVVGVGGLLVRRAAGLPGRQQRVHLGLLAERVERVRGRVRCEPSRVPGRVRGRAGRCVQVVRGHADRRYGLGQIAVTVIADQLLVVVGVLDQLAWSSALNVIVALLPRASWTVTWLPSPYRGRCGEPSPGRPMARTGPTLASSELDPVRES